MSNPLADFGMGFFLCILFCILVVWNKDRSVLPIEFYTSESVCKANGGLSKLSFDFIEYTIYCKSGAVFTMEGSKLRERAKEINNP